MPKEARHEPDGNFQKPGVWQYPVLPYPGFPYLVKPYPAGTYLAALRELEGAGYIVRHQRRDKSGRITDTEYVIYEQPHPDMSLNHTSVTLDFDLPALLALQGGLIPEIGRASCRERV